MISRTYILKNLGELNSAYRVAKTQKHAVYFSKLAILELCGWIEISMDDIIVSHCRRHVNDPLNTRFVHREIVKRTYGFDYKDHFRKMLINLIGIVTCEKLEASLPVATHTKFVAQLDSLKTVRNQLAHTYLKGPASIVVIDSPSVTISRFSDIHGGLKAFDLELRNF